MTSATDKNIRYTHLEDMAMTNAVLDGIILYKKPGTSLYRAVVREYSVSCEKHWTEMFWNAETGQHWIGDSYNDNKSIGDESYITWLSAPFALRKLALAMRIAAIP